MEKFIFRAEGYIEFFSNYKKYVKPAEIAVLLYWIFFKRPRPMYEWWIFWNFHFAKEVKNVRFEGLEFGIRYSHALQTMHAYELRYYTSWKLVNNFAIHWENYVSISFHIEWDMIVLTVFLLILNQMKINLDQNRKENCHHDQIPFNLKGNNNLDFSM